MRQTDDVREIEETGRFPVSDETLSAASEWIRKVQAKTGWPDKSTSALVRVEVASWIFATPHEMSSSDVEYLLQHWGRSFPGHTLTVLHSTVYIPMEVAHGDPRPDHGGPEGRDQVPGGGDASGRRREGELPDAGAGAPADGEGAGAVAEPLEAADPGADGDGERGGGAPGGARPATRAEDQRRRRRQAKPEAQG